MDATALLHSPPAIALVVAAAIASALAILLFAYVRRGKARMMSLRDAAAEAYESARRKRMVIAGVAERAGTTQDAIAWFVKSIASVIPTYRRRNGNGRFERLNKGAPSGSGTLHILKRDLAAYLRWARSMQ